jgi:acetyl-CoA acetyltransferase
MVLGAVEAALDDAKLSFDAVDAVVTASVDLFDGLTASNVAVTEVVGAVMKPETRIAADGQCALAHAACQIWAGAYKTVLVVAHGKPSMTPHHTLTAWAMDPIHVQPLGVDFLVCAGLVAQALAGRDAGAVSRWAGTAAARRCAAATRGVAGACTADEVLASPPVATPLTEQMCAPLADAACAVVLRRLDEGEETRDTRVLLRGVGHDLDVHSVGDRDLGTWNGLGRAYERACAQADVSSPSAFGLFEPACLYPHEEDLFTDAIGLDAAHLRESDNRKAALFSPEGGLFAGATPVAAGLSRVIASVRRLREDPQFERALAHGTWGAAGQGQAVSILEATT